MPSLAKALLDRFVMVTALGAICVTVSEFWFYEVSEEVGSISILLAYGVLAYLMMAVIQHLRVTSFKGFVLAAALFGFLVEGVPVPVVYSGLPLTIVWTSLAWHALITLGLFWLGLRWLLAHGSAWLCLAYCCVLGAFLGFWNAYMWNAQGTETGEVVFQWQPFDLFIDQLLFGYLMFLGGHLLFDRAYPKPLVLRRFEHVALWIFAAGLSVLTATAAGLLTVYPTLPVLVLLCLACLWRARPARESDTFVDRVYRTPVPLWRFVLTGLIPITALLVYAPLTTAEIAFEANVVLIFTAGPVSVGLFLWALVTSGGTGLIRNSARPAQ